MNAGQLIETDPQTAYRKLITSIELNKEFTKLQNSFLVKEGTYTTEKNLEATKKALYQMWVKDLI